MSTRRVVLLAAAMACAAGLAWPRPPQAKRETSERYAVVPSAALRFSAALEEQASPQLKKWVQAYVTKQMRERPVDPKATMTAVDEHFPLAPEEARDALTFLVFYAAYKDEDENQKGLSLRIRDIDREATEITRQILQISRDAESRAALPGRMLNIQQRSWVEEEVQKREAQLREYSDERLLKSTHMAASRRKADVYLKVLAWAYARMNGIQAAILHEVK